MNILIRAFCGAAACLVLSVVVSLDVQAKDTDCWDKEGEAQLKACTRIIERRRVNGRKVNRKTLGAAYAHRGFYYSEIAQYEKAIPDYDEAIKRIQNDHYAYSERAYAHFYLGNLDQALEDISAALRLENTSFRFRLRARTLMRLGRYDEALSDLNEALFLEPQDASSFAHRADLYRILGQYEDALRDYQKASQLDEGFEIPSSLRGLVLE